jgi:MFS family permease
LGTNIAIATTYGSFLSAPPYNWPENTVSYINIGQIVVSLACVPLLGNASDWIIKWRARRNGGVHEPEARLWALIFPVALGVISAGLCGQAASHPQDYQWFAICAAFTGYVFCFFGCNIVAITLLLDAYPVRDGPILVVICAFRRFISFGTSYGVSNFIETAGYDGSFGTYAALTGPLGLLGIPIYLFGKRVRTYTGRYAIEERSGKPSMTC